MRGDGITHGKPIGVNNGRRAAGRVLFNFYFGSDGKTTEGTNKVCVAVRPGGHLVFTGKPT